MLVAEVTAKEIGRVSLIEALELTVLIARNDRRRHPRALRDANSSIYGPW